MVSNPVSGIEISNAGDTIRAYHGELCVGKVVADTDHDETRDRNIYICNLWVHPDYRRQGIAKKLIERCLDLPFTWCFLWTGRETEETGSYALYEKCGFKELARLDDYYAPGVPTRLYGLRKEASNASH